MLLPFQGAGDRGAYASPGCRSACPELCAFWAFSPSLANGRVRGFVGIAFVLRWSCPRLCAFWAFSPFITNGWSRDFVGTALPLRWSCPRLCAFWAFSPFSSNGRAGYFSHRAALRPCISAAGLAARALRTAGTGHLPAHAVAKRRETSFSLLQKARLLHNERGFVYTKRIFTRLSLRQTKNVITFARNWLNYTRTRRRASRPPKPTRDAHAVYI